MEAFLAPDVGIVKVIGKNPQGEAVYTLELTEFVPRKTIGENLKSLGKRRRWTRAESDRFLSTTCASLSCLERDAGQEMFDRFSLSNDDLPVLICRGTAVLRNPTNEEITGCLGFNEGIDQAHVRDLIIVGAGPAGLGSS